VAVERQLLFRLVLQTLSSNRSPRTVVIKITATHLLIHATGRFDDPADRSEMLGLIQELPGMSPGDRPNPL